MFRNFRYRSCLAASAAEGRSVVSSDRTKSFRTGARGILERIRLYGLWSGLGQAPPYQAIGAIERSS
jgi:hypothetical protein